jgi:hypothetical protein
MGAYCFVHRLPAWSINTAPSSFMEGMAGP